MSIVLSTITEPYAKALLNYAAAKGILEEITQDIKVILRLLTNSKSLMSFLINPFITRNSKRLVLKNIVKDLESVLNTSIQVETLNFLLLLVDRNRIEIIKSISETFLKLSDEQKPVRSVEITTSIELTALQQYRLMGKLKTILGFEKIKLAMKVDPTLIGGLTIKSGSKLIDASLKKQLEKINRLFEF